MSNILITGANGFIGRNLVNHPFFNDNKVVLVTRTPINTKSNHENISFDSQNSLGYEKIIMQHEIDTVIHLAAMVHNSQSVSTMDEQLLQTNVKLPNYLAKAAIECGVKQFIFMSSIGVHGMNNHQFAINEATPILPQNAYTQSKAIAEESLNRLFQQAAHTQLSIIRPPMVYGSGSLGSFQILIKALKLNLPLPLNNIYNEKSFISINNLNDFIITLLNTPINSHETFVVADKEIISTSKLIETLKELSGSKSWIYSCPPSMLHSFFRLLKKENLYHSLFCNLAIDAQKAKTLLNWEARFPFKDEVKLSLR